MRLDFITIEISSFIIKTEYFLMIERLKFFLKDLCFCLLAKGKFIVFTMHSQ